MRLVGFAKYEKMGKPTDYFNCTFEVSVVGVWRMVYRMLYESKKNIYILSNTLRIITLK